jgi:deoxyribodipyrimidine photo-lyase
MHVTPMQPVGEAPVLLWFRNDLRLADHAALNAAAATCRPVVPVFVLDETLAGVWMPGRASRWWLHHSLAALARQLGAQGSVLVLRRGRADAEVERLVEETGAAGVFAACAVEPWARAVDERLATSLAGREFGFRRVRTTTLFDPDALRTQAGGAFGVYSPFCRAAFAAGGPAPPAASQRMRPAALRLPSDRLDDWNLLPGDPSEMRELQETWTPGEAGARARLDAFIAEKLSGYMVQRDRLGADGTSMLSPHLHFGEISAAQTWHAVIATGPGRDSDKFLRELLWREFSMHLLWHHPDLPERPLRPGFAGMRWRRDPAGLSAWQEGRTGVPIVDAGMRQLRQIGWMHNRTRMIAASFLVKHLLISWQLGEAWFWDRLVDADLANNSASWQWVTGCGTDPAPYFRVFNPVLQSKKLDPDGAYIRRWLPELAELGDDFIHAPWEVPATALRRAGVELGRSYPRPIVDLSAGRLRAMDAYAAMSRGTA